jgi:hypothetical protein
MSHLEAVISKTEHLLAVLNAQRDRRHVWSPQIAKNREEIVINCVGSLVDLLAEQPNHDDVETL